MSKAKKVDGTAEAWESGELGCDEKHAQLSDLDPKELMEGLGLQMISIRLQKSLIEDLKMVAEFNNLPYQSLIKQTLRRFADCEIKRILRDVIAEKAAKEKSEALEANESNAHQRVA